MVIANNDGAACDRIVTGIVVFRVLEAITLLVLIVLYVP